METRKKLKLDIRLLELSNERRLKENRKLKETAERLENENEQLKAELADIGPKYSKAMMANEALIKQWDKLKGEYGELMKAGRMVEHALEESTRVRKKLTYENRRIKQLLGEIGCTVSKSDDGELALVWEEKNEEKSS